MLAGHPPRFNSRNCSSGGKSSRLRSSIGFIMAKKQMTSNVSDSKASGRSKASDSNSNSNSTVVQSPRKRHRNGTGKARPSTGRFKGVVPQQNGNWGAQIYAKHQRVWLGTFRSEEEAAMAYDSAAIKLRSGDSHRNFPWGPESVEEPNFQSQFSETEVLGMIKDGSYRSKYEQHLRLRSDRTAPLVFLGPNPVGFQLAEGVGYFSRLLFQKELTPSDVGKLNRLVIPKKYAVKYFSDTAEKAAAQARHGGSSEDIQISFFDRTMRVWTFRFCYWSSSQSFVFTRGWSRFVKEKLLKANDTISFNLCESPDPMVEHRTFCMIEVNRNQGEPPVTAVKMRRPAVIVDEAESSTGGGAVAAAGGGADAGGCVDDEELAEKPAKRARGFKLFGVHIE